LLSSRVANELATLVTKDTAPLEQEAGARAIAWRHDSDCAKGAGAADSICAAGRILFARAACHARTGREYCRIFTAA
jgi:hypothetical protein